MLQNFLPDRTQRPARQGIVLSPRAKREQNTYRGGCNYKPLTPQCIQRGWRSPSSAAQGSLAHQRFPRAYFSGVSLPPSVIFLLLLCFSPVNRTAFYLSGSIDVSEKALHSVTFERKSYMCKHAIRNVTAILGIFCGKRIYVDRLTLQCSYIIRKTRGVPCMCPLYT